MFLRAKGRRRDQKTVYCHTDPIEV
eukprot:COSAG02_NODE_43183_length_377_cov_0.848921_1_plen_24_part_10